MSPSHGPDDAETQRIADKPPGDTVSMASRPSVAPTERASLPPTRGSPPTLSETAVVVLRSESAARGATFGRAAAVLSVAGLLFQMIEYREGQPVLKAAMVAALVLLGVAGGWIAWRARDPARYTTNAFRAFAVVGLVTSCVTLLYMGAFSPVTVVTALGLSFFALGDDRRFVGALCWAAVAFYLVLGLLVALDVVPDTGVFRAASVSREARLATLAMVTGVLAMTIYQARLSRRAMVLAVERANHEARVVKQREAQLREVKQDLDVVIGGNAARMGRYTGTRAGGFALGEVVGRGAMGEIYAAVETATGRDAAVKLLHAVALRDPDNRRRFLRELEIGTRLEGPNLVEVLAIGETEDQSPFLAMELLVGQDLGRLLRRQHMLPVEEACALLRDVTAGLSVAHAAGVVHRDLKPQNLFLADGPGGQRWKVLDFGVSRFHDSSGTLTEGGIIGTPAYMAPEQARSRPSDPRTDLFALGAVMYRVLTGRPPFTGDDTPQILFEVVGGSPPRPLDLATHLPRDVEHFLAIALAKEKADRFQSAEAMRDAFEAAIENRLEGSLRKKARALVAKAPWGKKLFDSRERREDV